MFSRRNVAALAIVAAAAICSTSVVIAAEQTIRLGWVTPDSPQDPYAIGAHAFKKAVERRSNGRIEVQLFPNRQLGDEKPLLEGIRFGTVDAGIIVNAVVSQLEPAFQIYDLPFVFANEEQAYKILDGDIGKALSKKLEAKGVIALAYMEGGFRSMVNNVRPVLRPEDVKSVKYRVMQNPVYIDMFNQLGGSAVPMAWGETFTAVQQGTIDGLEMPIALVDAAKYYEVTKYLSLTNHTYSVANLLISQRKLSRMPQDLQLIVREAAAEAVKEQRETHRRLARDMMDVLAKKGMKVNAVNDTSEFRKAVAPIYEKYRSAIGSDIVDQVLASGK